MKKDIFYKTQAEGFADVGETMRVIEKSAASQIHFLKKRVESLNAYKNQIETMFQRLSRFYWDANHPLLKQRTRGKRALLVLTGKRGIVGGLYHELVSEVLVCKDNYEYILVLGSRGKDYLEEEKVEVEDPLMQFSFDGLPRSEEINKMAAYLFQRFQDIELKQIDVLYPKFLFLAKQKPLTVQFLPFKLKGEDIISESNHEDGFPIFEPSKKFIFDELLKRYIDASFTEIILEAKLSELAARTVTAESAVKESERLVHLFNREFFKAKHLAVTQKQIESFSVNQLIS